MFRRRIFSAAVTALLLAAQAGAQQSAVATLSANFGGLAKLSFTSNSLAFPDANPDTVPRVPASPASIGITAKARASHLAPVTLTVVANDDLRSGITTIPAGAITWTASGQGFLPGTLNRTVPQLVASWTGSGVRTGTQEYFFTNVWTHPTGSYSLTLSYTLSSP